MPLNAGSLGNVFIRASRPPQTWLVSRDPTPYDTQGYALLDEWLNTTTNTPWLLVSLKGNSSSRGELAIWIRLGGGGVGPLISLTGNSGGAVNVDSSGNINVVGDGVTVNVVGNPATHTLTISATGSGDVIGISTQDGHTVTPTAGIIQLAGGPNLTTTGTVGPNTATISLNGITQHALQVGGAGGNSLTQLAVGATGQLLVGVTANDPIWVNSGGFAQTFPTDAGTATPSAGALTIHGTGGITTSGSGSTVTISGGGAVAESFVTDAGTATPAANVLTIHGAGGITTSGSGSTVTITGSGSSSGLVLIQTKTAASVTSLAFTTGITGTYNNYLLIVDSLVNPTGATHCVVQLSTNGGSSYISSGYQSGLTGLSAGFNNAGPATTIMDFKTTLFNMTSGTGYVTALTSNMNYDPSGPSLTQSVIIDAYSVAATTVNAINIVFNGGFAFSGNFSLYGYVK